MRNEILKAIIQNKIVTICRRIYGDDLLELAESLQKGGLKLIEVTFDQSDDHCNEKTSAAIRALKDKFGKEIIVGAGTVLTSLQVEVAISAGADYIISPNTNEKIIRLTKKLGKVSIPGAMTPTEIIQAHEFGADIVKVFPAGYLGLNYIKDIRGPISHIPLLAAGGINEDNIGEYFKAGYDGFGISGRLTDKKVLADKNFDEFTKRAKDFVSSLNSI